METKRYILAIVLCFVVLALYQMIFMKTPPAVQPPVQAPAAARPPHRSKRRRPPPAKPNRNRPRPPRRRLLRE